MRRGCGSKELLWSREHLQSASWPAGTRTTAPPSSRVRPTSCYEQMLRSSRLRDDVRGVDRLRRRRRRNSVSSSGGSSGRHTPSARRPSAAGGSPPGRTRAPCLRGSPSRSDNREQLKGSHRKYRKTMDGRAWRHFRVGQQSRTGWPIRG